MIRVKDLSKTFTRQVKKGKRVVKEDFEAVKAMSFEIPEGAIVGILGPNGAGKTTLLRMLAGILTPTSGSVQVGAYNYTSTPHEAKKQMGYLSGNTKLYGRLSPRELLTIFGGLYEMEREQIENRIGEIGEVLDMQGFMDNRIERLSTGQTQRVSIARCLIHSPKLYIFDEPTLGLDVLSSQTIIDFMKQEKAKGKTVLYSTHYMEEADSLCDYMMMIHEGEIIAKGTSEELKARTQTENLRDTFIALIREREEGGAR